MNQNTEMPLGQVNKEKIKHKKHKKWTTQHSISSFSYLAEVSASKIVDLSIPFNFYWQKKAKW